MITIYIYSIAGIITFSIFIKLYLANKHNPSEITGTVMRAFLGISSAFILYAAMGYTWGKIETNYSNLLIYAAVVALYTGFYFVAITPVAFGFFAKQKNIIKLALFIWLLVIYSLELLYLPHPEFTDEGIMLMNSALPVKVVVVSFLLLAAILNVLAWHKQAKQVKNKSAKIRSWSFVVASATGPPGIALMALGGAFARIGFLSLVICSISFTITRFIKVK